MKGEDKGKGVTKNGRTVIVIGRAGQARLAWLAGREGTHAKYISRQLE